MATGFLQITSTLADQALALGNVLVRVFKDVDNEVVFEVFSMTDENGQSEVFSLSCPPATRSLNQSNTLRPYEVYNVEVRLEGYETQLVQGIQIFDGVLSELPFSMVPIQRNSRAALAVDAIPDHHLLTNYGSANLNQPLAQCQNDYRLVEEKTTKPPERNNYLLNGVFIPRTIRVHLGRPTANAENITVDFIYYIKNVCSSEIYPTWPKQALLANIHAQVSLALNRVYTEWYPSKGYNYDITNSTAFDQAFVKNRNIFESISILVDDVFNQFLRKRNFVEPFYAEYCDGKQAQCPGMKQWGSFDLANKGMSAIQILQYYYTTQVRLVETDAVEDVKGSYPGVPLKLGSKGDDVSLIQSQLNAIAINYPNIQPIFPIDGIFNAATETAVKVFQKQFGLGADGIVGKTTWYKINYIYLAVRKLAELTSIGRVENEKSGEWPGIVLKEGSKGVEVQQLQFYLSSIALFQSDISKIPNIDGRFGVSTERAVTSFQKKYGLIQDGQVGSGTWNRIYEVYSQLNNSIVPDDLAPLYPGVPTRLGASGSVVESLQEALNIVSQEYPSIPVLVEDGIFGRSMQNSVIRFQTLFHLTPDGIIGRDTWNKIYEISKQITDGLRPSPAHPAFPGTILRNGSTGNDVRLIQERLNFISIYYKNIPVVVMDGVYGPLTQRAVLAFQKMLGLTSDGLVGLQTWNKIMQIYNELNGESGE